MEENSGSLTQQASTSVNQTTNNVQSPPTSNPLQSSDSSVPSAQPQVGNLSATQQPSPQQTMPEQQTTSTLPGNPKRKSKLKKTLMVIGVLVIVVGIIIAGALLLSSLIFKGVKDSPEVQSKVTNFMEHVSSESYQSAYALTSKDFKEVTPMDNFTRALSLFEAQYSGFQSQEQVGFYIEANAGQLTTYQYSAVVTYDNGDVGELLAVLVKEDGEYKILSMEVNVSIDRLEKFQQNSQDSVLGVSSKRTPL